MAVTIEQINDAARQLLSLYSKAEAKTAEALVLIQNLDPCSAGAKAALDKSKVVYDQGKSLFNNDRKPLLDALEKLDQQAEGEVKAKSQELIGLSNREARRLVAQAGLYTQTRDSFAEKIAKCPNTTPPAAKPNEPAANPAAPAAAGTDPKTNITGEGDGDKKTGTNTTAPATATNAAATAKAQNDINTKPGRRLYNPLSVFPSYTYNISLYMITPQAYDTFTASGRTVLPVDGVAVICQSGGVNAANQKRAEGFTLDYYLDNLRIETFTSGMDTQTSTNTTNIEFQINEPYGFSFITNLQRAADQLIPDSKAESLKNPTRQFYILGIRFTGFNNDGTPASSKQDPLFERFYDIYMSEVKFKLDNKATTYSIKAVASCPAVAFGTKRGIWDTGGTLRGTTVYDMLTNMMNQLNKTAADNVKDIKIKPNKYSFKFVGEGIEENPEKQKSAPIFRERMISETDVTKASLVGTKPTTTGSKAGEDQGRPDISVGELSIPSGTPILQAFETIISRSTYITSAFKTIQNNNLEPDPQNTNGEIQSNTDNKNFVRWYNVSAQISNGKFFDKIQDFTYDIMYVFQIYETPIITNAYSNSGIPYYGPHKRYKYWFTGQNSEILGYTQNLDNTFFTVAVGGLNKDQTTKTEPGTAVALGKVTDAPKTDTTNIQDYGKRAYVTSLFDPVSQANVSIKIMGDPDYLMPESTVPINKLYNRFYGTQDNTINPNGGQVFIEVDFKEPQDYNFRSTDGIAFNSTGTGLMSVNEKIQFWNYPKKVADIVEGVSYRLIKVSSKFDKGTFEQDLQCVINTFPDVEDDTIDDLQEVTVTGTKKTIPTPAKGLTPDKPPQAGTGNTVSVTDIFKAGQSANDDKNKFSLPNVTEKLNANLRDTLQVPSIPGVTPSTRRFG